MYTQGRGGGGGSGVANYGPLGHVPLIDFQQFIFFSLVGTAQSLTVTCSVICQSIVQSVTAVAVV